MRLTEILKENIDIIGFDLEANIPAGASLQGTITATFHELKSFFGQPRTTGLDTGKVRAVWDIEIKYRDDFNTYADEEEYDSVYVDIYDWKEEQQLEHVTRWNVSSTKNHAEWILDDLLAALRARG